MSKLKLKSIYEMGAVKRSAIVVIAFQVILWVTFFIAYAFNTDKWNKLPGAEMPVNPDSFLSTLLFIIGNNLILFLLIAVGNLFVRFGAVTPGLIIILLQGIMIGAMAGSNSFEFPFNTLYEANVRYLMVGLWETSAYALICGVTLTKSLNVADTFPAAKWSVTRKLKELEFGLAEKLMAAASILMLIISAVIEAAVL